MSRPTLITGALLIALSLSVFATKVFRFDIPIAPTENLGPWQVELRVSLRGEGGYGSVRAMLPASEAGQIVFDERSTSDRLTFSIRERGGNRVGLWTGYLQDVHEVVYSFRVQGREVNVPLPAAAELPEPPRPVRALWAQPSSTMPSNAPQVQAFLQDLSLPDAGDVSGRTRTLFAFVTHEVATVASAGNDALLALAKREAGAEGKERLLVTLLRAAGVPARLAHGLELRQGLAPEARVWVEAWAGEDTWVPMSAAEGFFETRPESYVVLGRGNVSVVEATGVRAVGHRFSSLREHLRPDEIANLLTPDSRLFASLSLYRLPLASQSALRVLLLIPLGALIIALYRNVVGILTYGTFMPVLIGLALREFELTQGMAMVAAVIGLGVVIRRPLDRLRLLMVPRLSILLCLVVLVVAGLALVADETGASDLFAGVLFPMVILTMLVERISITIAEEGMRQALVRAGWSVLVAFSIQPFFRSEGAEYLMFSFPELVLAVMGLLVWIGGYTGYRVTDLVRFRTLADPNAPGSAL